ncbi:MAG: sel1 repeat family protein [Magnetococcales bacterium]|nr:sel1 repeat family protein [Magnetococcales bacterium]
MEEQQVRTALKTLIPVDEQVRYLLETIEEIPEAYRTKLADRLWFAVTDLGVVLFSPDHDKRYCKRFFADELTSFVELFRHHVKLQTHQDAQHIRFATHYPADLISSQLVASLNNMMQRNYALNVRYRWRKMRITGVWKRMAVGLVVLGLVPLLLPQLGRQGQQPGSEQVDASASQEQQPTESKKGATANPADAIVGMAAVAASAMPEEQKAAMMGQIAQVAGTMMAASQDGAGAGAPPPVSFDQMAQQLAANGSADESSMRQMVDTLAGQDDATLQNMQQTLAQNPAQGQQMWQQMAQQMAQQQQQTSARGGGAVAGASTAQLDGRRAALIGQLAQQLRGTAAAAPSPVTSSTPSKAGPPQQPTPQQQVGQPQASKPSGQQQQQRQHDHVPVMTLTQYRQRYPGLYDEVSDQALADALYEQFYRHLPRARFDQQVGLAPAQRQLPLMTLEAYRQQYRHIYDDLTDRELVDRLYNQFYRHFSRSDYEQQIGWDAEAASQPQPEAMSAVDQALERGDTQVAFRLLLRLAQRGVVEGQFHLGYLLATGIGTRQDVQRAVIWWQRAADAGHELAKRNLAVVKCDCN